MYSIVLFALVSLAAGVPHRHNGRIFGGTDAVQGQFPFAVGIVDTYQVCDGVILNNRWILTAAQCAEFISENAVVVVGNVSLNSGTNYDISRKIVHEEYDEYTAQNDIALLELKGVLSFNDNVRPIEIGEVQDNQTCSILGWGSTPDTDFPETLQYADTTTISVEECKALASQIWDDLYLGPETLCTLAGTENTGGCYGDSGGPLVCDGKVAGIISYTIEKCGDQYPDVYLRTISYINWIIQNLSDGTTTSGTTGTTESTITGSTTTSNGTTGTTESTVTGSTSTTSDGTTGTTESTVTGSTATTSNGTTDTTEGTITGSTSTTSGGTTENTITEGTTEGSTTAAAF